MSDSTVVVSTWAKIQDKTGIEYHVLSDGKEVEFRIGGCRDGFELIATKEALRNLLAKGGEALQAAEAAEKQAERATM